MSTFLYSERRQAAFRKSSLLAALALVTFLFFGAQSPSVGSAQTLPPQHPAIAAPQALGLSKFTAKAKNNKVNLAWQTENEATILGFHVWRRTADGQYKRLDDTLIAAVHVGEITGSSYAMTDKTIKTTKIYYYQLEVVGVSGVSNWTEEVKVKFK